MRRITAVAVLLIAAAACPVCTSPGPSISCCLSVSNTVIHRHRIARYTVQEAGLCPVRAVVFHTRHRKIVCADPDRKWVRRVMRRLDEEREERRLGGTEEERRREEEERGDIGGR